MAKQIKAALVAAVVVFVTAATLNRWTRGMGFNLVSNDNSRFSSIHGS
jgi:hypothetical protein